MTLEGYCSRTSVFAGDEIDFHVSSAVAGEFTLTVKRLPTEDVVDTVTAHVGSHATPPSGHADGCGWPPCYSFRVPHDWSSGVYRVDVTSDEISAPDDFQRWIDEDLGRSVVGNPPSLHFVVKTQAPSSPNLMSLCVNTYQAYNPWPYEGWPGNSLYLSDGPRRSRKVSFRRPGGWPMYYRWENRFVRWLADNGIPCDFCTSVDLHSDPDLLNRYELLLSVGHDEYWSKEMRDNVEAFIACGRNVAFFSGDVCQWQVRLEDDATSMLCYKNAVEDPLHGVDDERVTVEWRADPVSRPENAMTGVSFPRNGAMFALSIGCDQRREDAAYEVRFPDHWIVEGAPLEADATFGRGENIVGYETDACEFVEVDGIPVATGRDGTPDSFAIVATSDLTAWRKCGKGGHATFGTYRRHGTVVTAGTTDWAMGLHRSNSAVPRITRNVIDRLSRSTKDDWEPTGEAPACTSMAAMEGTLFATSADGGLWCREPVVQNIGWQPIGTGAEFVGLCATEGMSGLLFALDQSGRLFRREPATGDADWEPVGGDPLEATDIAASLYKLFAVADGGLWWRDPMAGGADWERIDDAPDIVTLTAYNGALFAATSSGALVWRPPGGPVFPELGEAGSLAWRPVEDEGVAPWTPIAPAPDDIVALTVIAGRFFAATADRRLIWRPMP